MWQGLTGDGAAHPEPLAEGVLRQVVAGGERPFHDGPSQGLGDRPNTIALVRHLHGHSKSIATAPADWSVMTLSGIAIRSGGPDGCPVHSLPKGPPGATVTPPVSVYPEACPPI